MVEQTRERAAHLRLAETLSAFLTRLRAAAETLDIVERQRIVRPVVKEVLVNDDTIVIRHCIPVCSQDRRQRTMAGDGESSFLRRDRPASEAGGAWSP